MTRSVVHKLSNDPPWARDLITEFTPDSNGRVAVETVDPAGLHLSTQHSYDKNGNKLCTADPKGNATWFTYDSRNRLVTVTHADGTQKKIAYDNRGNKSSETDENGVDTLYEYDSLNRLTTQARDMDGNHTINPGDLVTRFTYNNVGSKLTQTDPNGNTTHFAYDDLQRLVTTTTAPVPEAPFGYTTTFSYGQNCGGSLFESSGFKPTQTVDPRGYVTTVTYDALYRPTTTVAQYQFSPAASATTTKEYDAVGNVIAVTDPLGKRTETDYDALNRPTVTRFAVVNNGQPNPSYGFTQNFYTSTGLKYQTLNENSVTSQTVYDAASRPVQTIADFGGLKATTQSYYDAAGNVVATINPVGAETDFGYDARNRKICQLLPPVHDATDSDLNSKVSPFISTSYDALGNVIAVTDARGNTTRTSFDPANRAVQVVAPAASVVKADGTIASLHPVSRTEFDLNGNVLETWRGGNTSDTISTSDTLVDPVKTAFNTYDALNHLTSTTDALGIKVANSYDPAGNRLSVTDGKLQTTFFAYDGLNRNLSITDPAGAATRFGYNAVDKTSRTDATGLVTEYGYDDRHRLSTVTYPDPRTVDNRQYAYDLVGNLRSVKLPGTSGVDFRNVFYTYDNINRQITEISCGATIYHYYDLAGNRLKTIFGYSSFRSGNSGRPGPPFGRTLISTYDALNRLSTLTESASPSITGSAVTRYGYDLNGNIYQLTQPNRDTTVKTYDALNRVTDIVTKTGGTIQFSDYTQTYDLPGNVAKVVETYNTGALNNRTVTNGYDLINRLTSESVVDTSGTVTTSYVFDNAHNRKSKTVTGGPNPGTTRYSCPNKLNQIQVYTDGVTTVNLAYDANGNLKTRTANGGQTDTYTYDAENRLIGLQKNIQGPGITNGFFQYAYDYRTRRVQRIEPNVYASSTTQLIFSGGQSIQEYSGTSNSPTVEYIRGSDYGGGIGGILYTLRSGTPSFNHYNNRGDVVAQTGLSGSTTYLAAYEAFGKRTQEFGSTQDRQKANTKDEDPTGLLNEGMRYRDLETGSFITRDPLGFVDGPNMYSYVNENPWSKFDPEGLAGYFFDGTDNDKVKKPKEATHIAALNDMYKGTAFYSPGVGNGNLAGSLFGAGASARINTMMSHLETQIANGDKNVDVFGFSRGAAEARGFVNQIAKKHPDVNVRFLGLFDSVAQVGAANGLGVSSHVGINMDIPSNVNFTAQAIAKNEHRGLFPLSSISNGNSTGMHFGLNDSSGSNFIEKGFAGAHADVGGGYSDGGNRNALQWMMGQASGHGVPLDWNRLPPTERSFFNASKLHNSEMSASGLGDLNPVGIGRAALGGRNVFSGNLKSSN